MLLKGTAQQKRFSYTAQKMGAPFSIVFYAGDSIVAGNLAKQCFTLVDSLVNIFSDYIDSSELSKLSAAAGKVSQPVVLSPAMYGIMHLSKTAFEQSEGAFDITIGPLSKLWRTARKTKQFPPDEAVQAARSLVGFNQLFLDTINKTLTLPKGPLQLDLGGIAQGYIAQKIIDFLGTQQVNSALVNASGDIVVSGPPPGLRGWTVGVNVPERTNELLSRTLFLQNKSVTTSGDVYQFIEHNGKRYSHIIDPRTGYGVTWQRNITVIAHNGVTADWLATACSILSIRKAKKLARQFGAQLLATEIKQGRLVSKATKDFELYWK